MSIGLEAAIPERDGLAERFERVLGRLVRATPMGDRDRRRQGEEGMGVYGSRDRGSTSLSFSQSRSCATKLGSIVCAIADSR